MTPRSTQATNADGCDAAHPEEARKKHWKNRARHGHHWRTAEDEFDACKFGMWLFLSTESPAVRGHLRAATRVLRHQAPRRVRQTALHYLDWRTSALIEHRWCC